MPPTADADPVEHLRSVLQRWSETTSGRARTGLRHDDADDVVGTAATDDAIGFDPSPVLTHLHRAGLRVVVIGQVAGILHGSVEPTGDLDLLWSGDPDQAQAMAGAFDDLGAELTDDDGHPIPCTADAFRLPKVQFRTASASGDCCTPALPWGELPVQELHDRAGRVVAGDGTVVHYLTAADLVLMRRAVGRP